MSITLPDLPYNDDALEPHISARTLQFHYGKHHRAYVDKLNAAIIDSDYAQESLENIVRRSQQAGQTGIFSNAAQAWNHTFLWHSMSPVRTQPSPALATAIGTSFGDLDSFAAAFKAAALAQFGSGWTWLVAGGDGLAIVSTANADTPLTDSVTPLLTLDVWEHAYYLDYQNDRARYIDTFISELINWEFASRNFEAAD